jgi:endonuclease/exonuclease/phosphatase (EEP) superfamily protein YafD
VAAPALNDAVRERRPDIVTLANATPECLKQIVLAPDYGAVSVLPGGGAMGLALYSRFPAVGAPRTWIGDELPPIVVAELEGPFRIRVLFLRAFAPLSTDARRMNRILLRRSASLLRHDNEDTIVAASLNATPFSRSYGAFTSAAEVWSAFLGSGLHGTLARWWLPPLLATDHLFFKGPIFPSRAEVLELPGFSHLPLFAEFVRGDPSWARWGDAYLEEEEAVNGAKERSQLGW